MDIAPILGGAPVARPRPKALTSRRQFRQGRSRATDHKTDRAPVDNAKTRHLGFRPNDNAERFAQAIFAEHGPLDPQDPANTHHGGPFAAVELGNSGVALLHLNPGDTGKS